MGPEAICACCLGAFQSPEYWTVEEARALPAITKAMIIDKRRALFDWLNDPNGADMTCKRCGWVKKKLYKDVHFDRLGHINLAHFSMCNLRCSFCGFTRDKYFVPPQYDAMRFLNVFTADDVEWDSYVDLNGGEPTLIQDLPEYIERFAQMKTRIMLYTNGVIYKQHISDSLKSGVIQWLVTSLDAGTPSTFARIKSKNDFEPVMENLIRYAEAGSHGGGQLAVKYIFCPDNCGEDDVYGFVMAMLAIRPQKVWLAMDFIPLCAGYEGQEQVGVYDYSKQINAYARMYLLLKQHGIAATLFAEEHLEPIMQKGKEIAREIREKIAELSAEYSTGEESLVLPDYRQRSALPIPYIPSIMINPLAATGDDKDNRLHIWKYQGA